MIRVLLVDDHAVVRKGLRFLLQSDPDVEVVAEAADGLEAVRLAEELQPDLVILDVAMPNLNGIQAAAQIRKRNASVGLLMLSMYADESYLLRALSAGANGYLLKDDADSDVLFAVRAISQGQAYFSPDIAASLRSDYMRRLQEEGLQDSYELLTSREKEILQLLAEGRSNKDAANLLNLSLYTVETHRTRMMQKLEIHNTAEIVLYAVRKNLIPQASRSGPVPR